MLSSEVINAINLQLYRYWHWASSPFVCIKFGTAVLYVTTQMKLHDEYFLMVLFNILLLK